MRSIYVVTHPEATHAAERLVGGWYDSDLTSTGAQHAERIAEALASRAPFRDTPVFSSDLRRTRRTAESIAARLGVDLVLDRGLREQSYGAAEGLPVGTIDCAPLPAAGDRLRHHDGVVGSETRLDVATRVYASLQRVLERGGEHAVVVTHGRAATFVIAAWIGMPLESLGWVQFTLSPGGITTLHQGDAGADRQVASLNDVTHLS